MAGVSQGKHAIARAGDRAERDVDLVRDQLMEKIPVLLYDSYATDEPALRTQT
jgi:hypothetical protein